MKAFVLSVICLLASSHIVAQIKLPRLISDGMVLQRNAKLKIWGWSSPQENIELHFKNNRFNTKATDKGYWEIILAPQTAGGPYEMTLKGVNEIKIADILIGDVWLCSGQSNMEIPMERVKEKYGAIIETSENSNIRHFLVPDKYDFKKEHDDIESGNWVSANPKNILGFSAIGYFFARKIYEQHHVPIGLINSALGGSPVEAWISEDALISFPDHYAELQRFKNDNLIEEIETTNRSITERWYKELLTKDQGVSDDGTPYADPQLNDGDWNEMNLPGQWSDGPLGNVHGSLWFRRQIIVPKSMAGKPAKLWMGRIVDQDSVFVNGKFVGTTGYQYPPRRYQVPEGILKEGTNTICVRVINNGGHGGFILDKPYYLAVGSDTLDLKGKWKYKVGTTMPAMESQITVRWKPSGLYNKMISPLLSFPIKGVIWYQGESNTSRAKEYENTFPAMINNWRQKWNQGDFPFLFVQLANFMETTDAPGESEWAELREAQRKTLRVPNTAMVVTIDLGEWNDIHPLNKKDVGERLAIAAENLAYGNKKQIPSGPLYKSMTTKGSKIVLMFDHVGKGLTTKDGKELTYFSIAGPDHKYVWARAEIKGKKVVVQSDQINNPIAVRYAWADNPQGANLYNADGLPASPFEAEKK
jgi:sialate O-acetylesterase